MNQFERVIVKSLLFAYSKQAIILVAICSVFSYGCKSSSNRGYKSSIQGDENSSSPTQGTKIYRYLSAISNAYPDEDSLTSLCVRQHGFEQHLPRQSVKSAHDNTLPASKEWSEVKQIERQRYRTEIIQPPSVNGIVMQPVEKRIPYKVTENIKETKRVSGNCIGTEYILR